VEGSRSSRVRGLRAEFAERRGGEEVPEATDRRRR